MPYHNLQATSSPEQQEAAISTNNRDND